MRQIKEVTTLLESQNYPLNLIICDVMKKFKFKTLIHEAGFSKACGFSISTILTLLIMLPLMLLENVHQFYKSAYAREEAMHKDTIYRLKNNEKYPWRSLLYKVAKTYRSLIEQIDSINSDYSSNNASEEKKPTALIIDDTTDLMPIFRL